MPVTTRRCFESSGATSAVFALRTSGLMALAHRLVGDRRFERALSAVRFGSDRFVIQAAAVGQSGAGVDKTFAGRGECRATGVVAAAATRAVVDGHVSPGAHHLDEIVSPAAFLAEITAELACRRRPAALPRPPDPGAGVSAVGA